MINSKKTLTAYLDILGYREIIENKKPEDFYSKLCKIFAEIEELTKGLKSKNLSNARIIKAIQFKILSDSIIIYLNMEVTDGAQLHNVEENHENVEIILFFHIISTFILLFIAETGYLLRGGVCLGEFYTNSFDDSLLKGDLIFSEAFVRSYSLEQAAIHPRVLVDKPLHQLWQNARKTSISRVQLKQDQDGEFYVDFYEMIRGYTFIGAWLSMIHENVKKMLQEKEGNQDVWRKWHWFKEYHNHKVETFVSDGNKDLQKYII